jgi:hypothetical protein
MARWALVDIDERKMTKSRPMFHDAKLAGSTIVLKFNEAGAGLRIRDDDGRPDEWERRYGLNPLDPSDGNLDKDYDGYLNIEEFLNGTDPRKGGS